MVKVISKIIKYGRHLLTYEQETTAEKLKRELSNKGVLTKDIGSEHIMPVYASLRKISSAPKQISVIEILPNNLDQVVKKSPPVFGVIVETRKHDAIDTIVNSFINNLNIPVQIFHGNRNRDFILSTSISELVKKRVVYLTHLDIDDLCASKYNELFLSKTFWKRIVGRNKILIFQTDSFLCSNSDYTIKNFMKYDYIGSKWPRYRPVGLIMDGGSGGLSLRDWGKTYECLKRFPPKYWWGGEDGYFAFHIELMEGKIGRDNDCAKFSTQDEFLFKSWGGHKIACLRKEDQDDFFDYCPEAKLMM